MRLTAKHAEPYPRPISASGQERRSRGFNAEVCALGLLVLILLLAAALRLSGAATRPAWTDEGWSTWAARDHRPGVILDKLADEGRLPSDVDRESLPRYGGA